MPPLEPIESAPDEPPQQPLARVVAISCVAVAILLAAGVGGMELLTALKQAPVQTERSEAHTAVRVETAIRRAHQEQLTGYGRARALRHADVPAEIAGTVIWVSPNLDAGRVVAAGEELVRLDARDAESAARSAEAKLAQAEARALRAASDKTTLTAQIEVAGRELEASRRELERLLELVKKATSESEVDGQRMAVALREQSVIGLNGRRSSADADGQAAAAEMAAAAAALATARHDLERTIVRAPYDSSIVARHAQLGERVALGTALFSIVDLRHIEIPVSLPASRYGEVTIGANATVRLREGGETVWSGAVTRLAATVDAESRTFRAFIDIVGAEGDAPMPVAPGAFAIVTVAGRITDNVVVVPREAFVGDALHVAEPVGDADTVTRAREAVVRELHPTVVRRLPDVMLIGNGLPDGSLVIVTSVDQIADGARVLVLPEESGDAAATDERDASGGVKR